MGWDIGMERGGTSKRFLEFISCLKSGDNPNRSRSKDSVMKFVRSQRRDIVCGGRVALKFLHLSIKIDLRLLILR